MNRELIQRVVNDIREHPEEYGFWWTKCFAARTIKLVDGSDSVDEFTSAPFISRRATELLGLEPQAAHELFVRAGSKGWETVVEFAEALIENPSLRFDEFAPEWYE